MSGRAVPHAAGQEGHTLITVMILVFTMLLIGTGFFSLVGNEVKASQADLDSQRAFWLAEAGKERGLRHLQNLSVPPASDFFIYQNVPGPNGGHYSVHCAVDTSRAWSSEKAFVLESVGNSRGVERRIRQWVKMTSFAQYAMFTDDESNGQTPLWYITGDRVEGRLHTNGRYNILGTPVFLDRVSSSSDHMRAHYNRRVYDMADWPVGGNAPVFADGADMGVPVIPMPTNLPDLRNLSQTGGVYANVEMDIELGIRGAGAAVVAPGWFRYRDHSDTSGSWTEVEISTLPDGVFYCENDVHIEGTLDGELTVASAQNVRIVDDLLYADSDASGTPRVGCNDLLGLVAEQNVIFADNAANANDLVINGVLMALGTSITAENYWSGSPRGTLTIWGGLIQKYRGAVGQSRGGQITSGYLKDYHYDARVTGRTPPSYPQTGRYERTAWEETWDVSNPFN